MVRPVIIVAMITTSIHVVIVLLVVASTTHWTFKTREEEALLLLTGIHGVLGYQAIFVFQINNWQVGICVFVLSHRAF